MKWSCLTLSSLSLEFGGARELWSSGVQTLSSTRLEICTGIEWRFCSSVALKTTWALELATIFQLHILSRVAAARLLYFARGVLEVGCDAMQLVYVQSEHEGGEDNVAVLNLAFLLHTLCDPFFARVGAERGVGQLLFTLCLSCRLCLCSREKQRGYVAYFACTPTPSAALPPPVRQQL